MRAGKFDRNVEIWRRGPRMNDGYGAKSGDYILLASRSAQIIRSRGREIFENHGRDAVVPCTFILRDDPVTRTIDGRDQIRFESKIYDIESVNEVGRGEAREFIGIAQADEGA